MQKFIHITLLFSALCFFPGINLYAATDIDQGYVALANKEYLKATQYFQIAIKNNPASIEAKLGLAKTYVQRGKRKRVEVLTENIIKIEPNNIEALLLQSQVYMWNSDWELSQQTLNKILGINPQNVKALTYLSQTLYSLNKSQEADAIYEQIKQIQGNLQ